MVAVDITGLNGTPPPEWANEATTKLLLAEIQRLYGVTDTELKKISASLIAGAAGGGGTANPALLTAIRDLQLAITANTNSTTGGGSGGTRRPNTNPGAGSLNQIANELNPDVKLGPAGNVLWKTFQLLSSVVGVNIPAFDNLKGALIGTATAISTEVFNTFIDQGKLYTDLYKSGLLFSTAQEKNVSSMGKFGTAADTIGISFGDLSNVMKNHSKVINRDGIQAFSSMANSFKKVGQEYGYTASESTEYLASYMEQQRLANTLNLMSEAQIRAGAANQMKSSMELARAFGLTTKELEDSKSKMADSLDLQTAMASLPDNIQKQSGDLIRNMTAGFELAGGQMGSEMSNLLLHAISQPTTVAGEEMFQAFNMMGVGGQEAARRMVTLAEHVRSGTATQEEANMLMESIGKINSSMSNEQRQYLTNLAQHNSSIRTLISLSTNYNQQLATQQAKEKYLNDGVIDKMTGFASVYEKLKDTMNSVVDALWRNTDFVDAISAAMEKFSTYMTDKKTTDAITLFATTLVESVPKIVKHLLDIAKFFGLVLPGAETEPEKVGEKKGEKKPEEQDSRTMTQRLLAGLAGIGVAYVSWKQVLTKGFTTLFTGMKIPFGPDWLKNLFTGGPTMIKDSIKMLFSGISTIFTSGGMGIMAKISGIIQMIKSPFMLFAGIGKLFGPLSLIISGFIGMIKGIFEFNTDHTIGSMFNIILRIVQGVVMDGIVGFFNLLCTGVKYIIAKIPGLNYFMDDDTKQQSFGEMMDNTAIGQGSAWVNKQFDKSSNILTGNKPTSTPPANQVKEPEKPPSENDTNQTQTTQENQQAAAPDVINTQSNEQLVALNKQMAAMLVEAEKQNTNLRTLINNLPSSYLVG